MTFRRAFFQSGRSDQFVPNVKIQKLYYLVNWLKASPHSYFHIFIRIRKKCECYFWNCVTFFRKKDHFSKRVHLCFLFPDKKNVFSALSRFFGLIIISEQGCLLDFFMFLGKSRKTFWDYVIENFSKRFFDALKYFSFF